MSDLINKYSLSSTQKAIIIIIFAIVFIICLIQLVLSKPIYQVKASILVQRNDLGVAQIDEFLEFNNPEVSNIVQRLKSVNLLQKTLRQLNYNYPVDSEEFLKIQQKLAVKQVPPSNAIEITLRHPVLNEAILIVNTLVENLIQEDLTERRQKIHQALESVQSALTLIHTKDTPMQSLPLKTNNNSIDNFLKELNDDLYKTELKLLDYQSNLSANQIEIIKDVFSPQNLERFKPTLAVSEKKLVRYLVNSNWNNQNVQNLLKTIWKEKTKVVAIVKEQLNMRSDIPSWMLDNISAYQIRRFDLLIRKQELINKKQTILGTKETQTYFNKLDNSYESLKEIEMELLKKQTILQSLNDLTLAKIRWIDKSYPVKPLFRSGKILTLGLSFGIAFIVALVTGLLFFEFNSYKRSI